MSPLFILYPPDPLNPTDSVSRGFLQPKAQGRQSYRGSKRQAVPPPPPSVIDNRGLGRLGDLPQVPQALQQQSLTQNTGRQTPLVIRDTERTCP